MSGRRSRRIRDGGVSDDLRRSRNFLALLGQLVDAEQDGDFEDHLFDPGAFQPTKGSLQTVLGLKPPSVSPASDEPKPDEQAEPTAEPEPTPEPEVEPEPIEVSPPDLPEETAPEEPAAEPELKIAAEQEPKPTPEPEVEPEPTDASEDRAAIIQLHPPAPAPEPEAAHEPDIEPEVEAEGQDAADEITLLELIAYANALHTSHPLAEGLESISLRRILRGLDSAGILVEAVGTGSFRQAKGLLSARHRTLKTLLDTAQKEMTDTGAPGDLPDEDQGLIRRLSSLVAGQTEQLADVHTQIYTSVADAQAITDAVVDLGNQVTQHEDALLAQVAVVKGLEAHITRYHLLRANSPEERVRNDGKRDDFVKQMRTITARIDTLHAQMRSAITAAKSKLSERQTLNLTTRKPRDRAKRGITQLRAQVSAVELLGTRVPDDLLEQIEGLIQPLDLSLRLWKRSTPPLETLELSVEVEEALEELDGIKGRVIALLSAPEGPFLGRETRELELRKLLLITMELVIPEGNETTGSGKEVPHRGYKPTHYLNALLELKYITRDELELERELINWAKLERKRKVNPKLKYAKGHGRKSRGKNWHSYNLTQDGHDLAQEYLRELRDRAAFTTAIRRAFKKVLPNYWQ